MERKVEWGSEVVSVRRAVGAWLGTFAIVLQALLSPVLAIEMSAAYGTPQSIVVCTHDGLLAVVDLADTGGSDQSNKKSSHGDCPVCTFLQATKGLLAPATIALAEPYSSVRYLAFAIEPVSFRTISTCPYASRAPPAPV